MQLDWNKKTRKDFEQIPELVRLRSLISEFIQRQEFSQSAQFRSIISTGMLAEYYCQKLFDLKPFEVWNGPYDAITRTGKKIEIKTRTIVQRNPLCPPGMKINLAEIDAVFYVYFTKSLSLQAVYAIRKEDITTLPGGRVSFQSAFDNGKAELIYEDK